MLDIVTKLITSPPAYFVAGGILFGIVYKFFERIENVLNEDTKMQIAIWLLDVNVGRKAEQWPRTITKILDRLFGIQYPSWSSFLRSALMTLVCVGVLGVVDAFRRFPQLVLEHLVSLLTIIPLAACIYGTGSIIPDYMALLLTRMTLKSISIRPTHQVRWMIASAILNTVCGYAGMAASLTIEMMYRLQFDFKEHWTLREVLTVVLALNDKLALFLKGGWIWFFPGMVYFLIVVLYVASGFVIRAAHRFDIGFQWFNRRFDIEKKPLQSIGLVAGALIACAYWVAMIARRLAA